MILVYLNKGGNNLRESGTWDMRRGDVLGKAEGVKDATRISVLLAFETAFKA